MPSHRGTEQAITWLRSKMAEGDTLDAINAEVCLNVINDLKRQRDNLGAKLQISNGDRDIHKRRPFFPFGKSEIQMEFEGMLKDFDEDESHEEHCL